MPDVSCKKICFARKNHEINVMLHTGSRFVEIAKTVGEATEMKCKVQSSVSKAINGHLTMRAVIKAGSTS